MQIQSPGLSVLPDSKRDLDAKEAGGLGVKEQRKCLGRPGLLIWAH